MVRLSSYSRRYYIGIYINITNNNTLLKYVYNKIYIQLYEINTTNTVG